MAKFLYRFSSKKEKKKKGIRITEKQTILNKRKHYEIIFRLIVFITKSILFPPLPSPFKKKKKRYKLKIWKKNFPRIPTKVFKIFTCKTSGKFNLFFFPDSKSKPIGCLECSIAPSICQKKKTFFSRYPWKQFFNKPLDRMTPNTQLMQIQCQLFDLVK